MSKFFKKQTGLGEITPQDREKLSYRSRMEASGETAFLAEMPDLLWFATSCLILLALWTLACLGSVVLLGVFGASISKALTLLIRSALVFAGAVVMYVILWRLIDPHSTYRTSRKQNSKIYLLLAVIFIIYTGLVTARPYIGFLQERAAIHDYSGDYAQLRAERMLREEVE